MRPRRIVLSVFLLCFLAVLLNICFRKLQRTIKSVYHSGAVSPSDEAQTKIGGYPSSKNRNENGLRHIEALQFNRRQYKTKKLKISNSTRLFKGCETRKCKDPSKIPTPFKIYVYELPSYFNNDIQRFLTDSKKFSYCFNLDNCGMGEEMYQIDNKGRQLVPLHANGPKRLIEKGSLKLNVSSLGTRTYLDIQSVRNTHQFALEVIIHCKLLHSPYRTLTPEEADFFYIPVYAGLNCISEWNNNALFVHHLFDFMRTNKNISRYYNSGKPHFMTISKIQREMAESGCSILYHPDASKITFIAIERETNPSWLQQKHLFGRSIVVAPYPSYIHYAYASENTTRFTSNSNLSLMHLPDLQTRNVLLFLAASKRRSNPFRARILDQFRIKTSKSPKDFFSNYSKGTPNVYVEQIMLVTNECSRDHRSTTVLWMRSSTYCLQPPGDSSTRKSIYDSILSGCIPVLFKGQYKTEYPFQRVLDYDTFTYSIDNEQLAENNRTVLEIVKAISPQRTKDLNYNLRKVAKWFQYSIPSGDIQWEKDALTMILDELAYKYRLKLRTTPT